MDSVAREDENPTTADTSPSEMDPSRKLQPETQNNNETGTDSNQISTEANTSQYDLHTELPPPRHITTSYPTRERKPPTDTLRNDFYRLVEIFDETKRTFNVCLNKCTNTSINSARKYVTCKTI